MFDCTVAELSPPLTEEDLQSSIPRAGTLESDIVPNTFTTYIRPILECNSNVWNPSKKYLTVQLENVHRRFTKRVTSLEHFS